jgi:hypothetical protein
VSDVDPADVAPRTARFSEKKMNKELDDIAAAQLARKAPERGPEREGLPAGYRMRADAHYVEQLSSRSADMPVRWIALDEINGAATFNAEEIRPLVQSIVEHGIVQPLLVRQNGGQYRLIAGRKRLAAARLAALSRVPCLVHQVDEAQAEALAVADNLRLDSPDATAAQAASPILGNLINNVSEAVKTIGSASTLLVSQGSPMAYRVALDLVKAETWRASWQLRAAAIVGSLYEYHYRLVLLATPLGRVREGFAAESRLSGIGLKLNLMDSNVSADVDEEAIICGVTGAVMAVAGLVGNAETPEVSVAVRASAGKALSIDVTQEAVGVNATVASRFLEPTWTDRPGGWPAALGVGAAKAVAQKHAGDVLFLQREGRGSTVRLTLGR